MSDPKGLKVAKGRNSKLGDFRLGLTASASVTRGCASPFGDTHPRIGSYRAPICQRSRRHNLRIEPVGPGFVRLCRVASRSRVRDNGTIEREAPGCQRSGAKNLGKGSRPLSHPSFRGLRGREAGFLPAKLAMEALLKYTSIVGDAPPAGQAQSPVFSELSHGHPNRLDPPRPRCQLR
jgi:hypothetical protein